MSGIFVPNHRNITDALIVNFFEGDTCEHILTIFIPLQASCTSSAVISQHSTRDYSSVHTQQPAGPIREYKIDPYILLEDELKYVFEDIRQVG